MRCSSVPLAAFFWATFSMMPRSCGRVFSRSSMNEPQLDLSDGISTVLSHLPFRYSKKSSCGRTDDSMYWVAMPALRVWPLVAVAFAAAAAPLPSAWLTLAIRARVRALNRYCFFIRASPSDCYGWMGPAGSPPALFWLFVLPDRDALFR